MTDQERGFAPTDPSVEDDLLAPEAQEEPEDAAAEETSEHEGEPEEVAVEDEAEPPRRPGRQFARIGWALVAVIAVIGIVGVVELVRISSAIDNTACVQKAQAQFMQALGPGVSPQFAGLDRLAGIKQLKSCGQ
jgi:hypothetical protein